MPAGIGNAEVRVEVLETKSTVNPSGSNLKSQVIEFTLFSTDIEPKEWTFIYYDQRNTQWVWVPKDHIVIVDDITMFQLPNAPLGSELPLPVLDDITIPGEYTIRFDLSTMAPGALLIGNLIVSNAGLLSQKYTCEISGATFILTRQQESNTWTPWFCISGLNNFFTPANLVAGTNLQITRAADESGYDKYTVGTTDKVYTQDNLIAGNNIEFYNVGQINISSSDIIGTQTISSDGKFISTSNSYIRLSSTSMPGYSGQIFMSGAPWEYIIKFKTPNDFSKKARITHFGTLRQYPAIACGIIGENDIGGQTTSDDIRKIAFAVNTSQDWKGEYSEYKVLANTWYKIKIYRDQQNHAYKVDLFDNGSWINIISISGDPYTRWSAPDYIFIGSADTAEIGENIPLEYDFKDLSFNSSSLTTNPWVAITEGSETQINAPTMTGATSLANGTSGTVPAPTIADKDKYLKGDGTWSTTVPTLTWYTNNTTASITIVDTSTARLVKVYYNGVLLQPTEDYTINGTTLTFIGNVLAASNKVAVEVFN